MEKKNNHQHLSPKDVFLHVLLIITLYFSAGSFITLLFQFVNIGIPDVLTERYFYTPSESSYLEPLRFAVASLLVVFPSFMGVSWYLQRFYRAEPAKRELRLRKWLMNFTLFAAALIIGGDLVSLVNSYLGGELTSRFALKALSVLLVAGTVFGYYLWDIRQEHAPKNLKMISVPVSVVVGIGVVAAFFFAGSPQEQRALRFDNQRISDLQVIQSQIVSFWQRKEKLPVALAELEDDISGFQVPRDPETLGDYSYTMKGLLTFELCATFRKEGGSDQQPMSTEPVMLGSKAADIGTQGFSQWAHGVGRECFERTIDKELYPPEGSVKW